MSNPLISVIIPVFNGGHFLQAALESIFDQAYVPLEVIGVDDGSADETPKIVRDFAGRYAEPVHYLHQENRGPAAARNHGLRVARGSLIAFQDADDLWTPEKLAIQSRLLAKHPDCGIVRGWSQIFRRVCTAGQDGETEERKDPQPLLSLQSAVFRRAVFDEVGLFDESLRKGEDVDWYLRAKEKGIVVIEHTEVVLLYRRHADNLTKDFREIKPGMLGALRRAIRRREHHATAQGTGRLLRAESPLNHTGQKADLDAKS